MVFGTYAVNISPSELFDINLALMGHGKTYRLNIVFYVQVKKRNGYTAFGENEKVHQCPFSHGHGVRCVY